MVGKNKTIDWKAAAAVSIVLAALATAVGAEGPGEECVVYVYKLNVLDAPELGDVITALAVGTRVTAWETAADEYGNAFRRVRAGDVVGWVRADELVPAETYDATAEKEYGTRRLRPSKYVRPPRTCRDVRGRRPLHLARGMQGGVQ
jgi:hypothetical protein